MSTSCGMCICNDSCSTPIREQVVGAASWVLQDAKPAKNPFLSSDGKAFVFDSIEGSQEDVFLIRADGTGLRRLTDDGFKDRAPRWSPSFITGDRGHRRRCGRPTVTASSQSITLSSDNLSIGVALAINEADIWLASLR